MQGLTPEERTQIVAALEFWAAVAETSQTHPSRHPALGTRFEQHFPLPAAKVQSLAQRIDKDQGRLVSPTQLAERFNVSVRSAHRALKEANVAPVYPGRYSEVAAIDAMHARGYDA